MRILGLDYGERSIGVAVSDPLFLTAQGITVLRRREEEQDLEELDRIKEEYEIGEVVVGQPRNMNGTLGPMGQRAQAFADILGERWSIPVHMWDERLSTRAAERVLLEADLSRKRRKSVIDMTAAVLILQSYLEKRHHQEGSSVDNG